MSWDHTFTNDAGEEIHWTAPEISLDPFDEPPIEDIVLPMDLQEYREVEEAILEDLYSELEL